MATMTRRYPVGIQTFERIREEGFMYVDKMEYVYRLTHQARLLGLQGHGAD